MNIVVVGAQWGDEGKGKVIDVLSSSFDYVVRFQGGNNAGHTVRYKNKDVVLHTIPSGVFWEHTKCVIGNGVIINPLSLFEEIKKLEELGVNVNGRLYISNIAHCILPYHWKLDEAREGRTTRIGTTKRGIGPCYGDKAARMGIRVEELFERKLLKKKIKENLMEKNIIFSTLYNKEKMDEEEIVAEYLKYGKMMKPYVTDTVMLLNKALMDGKSILFEGAQGALLDVDFGTYPYVTSSNTIAGSVCIGAGIPPTLIEKVVGVIKAYTTRVGEGPFPTEFSKKMTEAVRIKGREYGATTGRPRRCGWLDIVSIRYAMLLNNFSSIIVTKLDVLNELEKIKICVAYKCNRKKIEEFPSNPFILKKCEPIYEELPGWEKEIKGAKQFDELPKEAQLYLERISQLLGIDISLISIGPEREDTIYYKTL